MRDHDAPASSIGVFGGLNGLCEGTDLVDLEQQCIAGLERDGFLDADGVCDGQVITAVCQCSLAASCSKACLPNDLEV